MKTILLKQKQERDELLSRPYQIRKVEYDKDALLGSPLIKLITGPRRVGKSVYALLMLRGKEFGYLNFDDAALLDHWNEDLILAMLDETYPDYAYLLLDEVQNLPQWDIFVSKLYRRGKNLIITGSNAKMLSSEMATVLTGRYIQIRMLPFSLHEALEWGKEESASDAEEAAWCDEYMRLGGFPETIRNRSLTKSYLGTLFDSILLKDISRRHKVRNTSGLYNLASYLLSNFCNTVSANSIAEDLGLTSVATVKKFCSYLTEPYVFYFLPRFNNKLRIMTKAPKKVYIVDNGFVYSSGFNLSENLGRLLENQVFVELLRRGYEPGKTVFYYKSRNDKEIDFVLRNGHKIDRLIQVSYDMSSDKTRKRELNALIEAGEELGCRDYCVIVANGSKGTINFKDYDIDIIPVKDF